MCSVSGFFVCDVWSDGMFSDDDAPLYVRTCKVKTYCAIGENRLELICRTPNNLREGKCYESPSGRIKVKKSVAYAIVEVKSLRNPSAVGKFASALHAGDK